MERDKDGRTHADQMERMKDAGRLSRACSQWDMTFGGLCFNCGFEPKNRGTVNPRRCYYCGSKGEHLSGCRNPSLARETY